MLIKRKYGFISQKLALFYFLLLQSLKNELEQIDYTFCYEKELLNYLSFLPCPNPHFIN